jgi:putative endonuclease
MVLFITMSRWFVYIVRCADGSLYTGITNDLVERIKKHNAGKGAKYTRSRRPVKLVWRERKSSEQAARRREAMIKNLPRAGKLALIKT